MGLVVLISGCGPPDAPAEAAGTLRAEESAGIHVETALTVTRQYLRALAERDAAGMRAMLAPGPRSDATQAGLVASGRGIASLTIAELEPEVTSEDRIVLRARLRITRVPDADGEWVDGENRRWVELMHTRAGWRIQRIAAEPIGEPPWHPVVTWAQAFVMEEQLSVDVPNGWQRRPNGRVWSPHARGLPEVGLAWYDAPSGWDPTSALADDGRIVAVDSLGIGWRPGTMFTLEVPDALEGPTAVVYEKHVIVRSPVEGRVYDFFGRARSMEDLRSLVPVLRRMSASASRDSAAMVSVRRRRLEPPAVDDGPPEPPRRPTGWLGS